MLILWHPLRLKSKRKWHAKSAANRRKLFYCRIWITIRKKLNSSARIWYRSILCVGCCSSDTRHFVDEPKTGENISLVGQRTLDLFSELWKDHLLYIKCNYIASMSIFKSSASPRFREKMCTLITCYSYSASISVFENAELFFSNLIIVLFVTYLDDFVVVVVSR